MKADIVTVSLDHRYVANSPARIEYRYGFYRVMRRLPPGYWSLAFSSTDPSEAMTRFREIERRFIVTGSNED